MGVIVVLTALFMSAVPARAETPSPTPKATASLGGAPASATPKPTPTGPPTPKPISGADLAAARARLSDLEEEITTGEVGVKKSKQRLERLTRKVNRAQGTLAEIDANLKASTTRIKTSKAKLISTREKMHERARELYKRGPASLIGVVLGAEDMRDFVGRMEFASTMADRDEALVLETRKRRAELERIVVYQQRLQDHQVSTVKAVKAQQEEIYDVFAEQQGIMSGLAKARASAMRLIMHYEKTLGVGEFSAARRVAGRGMTLSYGEWAEAFLRFMGAPVSRETLIAVVAWQASEGTQATWNPLATTMPMPRSTVYNSHGVRNYESLKQGIRAVKQTLGRPNYGYEKILDTIERGADAMDIGEAINQSHWCKGCTGGQYVIGIIPAVERYYDSYAG